jgi:hypothetical protein
MKISEILNESVAKPVFKKEYPLSRKMAAVRSLVPAKIFDKAADAIVAALATDEVISTKFDTIKHAANKFVEGVFEGISSKYYYGGQYENLPEDLKYFSFPSEARLITSMSKKLDKVSKDAKTSELFTEARAITDELLNLAEVIEYLKVHMVKASVKKAEAKEARKSDEEEYRKKYTSNADIMKVIALLKKTAKDIEDGIYKKQLETLTKIVENFQQMIESTGTSNYRDFYSRMPRHLFTIQGLVHVVNKTSNKEYELDSDWLEKIKKTAKQTAADIIDNFIYKNSGKLSYIIATKNDMKSVEIKNISLSRGAVECDLYVTFNDGSEFVANSSVVLSYSALGKPFYRYPTVFSNVKLPGGKSMTGASEQKMDEVFAITK